MTEIIADDNVFLPGKATVLSVDRGDIPKETDRYGKVIKEEQISLPFGEGKDSLFIHVNTDTNLVGIDSFYVGAGGTEQEAMADLLTQGAACCVPLNLNSGTASEKAVYLGYSRYNPDYTQTKRTKYYMELAVKDLLIWVGTDPQRSMKVNGLKYTLVSKNSLNEGNPGTSMYLYQTTALINDKDKSEASFITSVAAAKYDRVPADIAENRWENLLTTDDLTINVNDGYVGYDASPDRHIVDSRIHLFVHRNDNYVKPKAVITGGYSTETTIFGDIALSKK